jgi:nuclear transport factor 2 (NTF2) superfamily protein
METERPPFPPFTTVEAAVQKIRLAEDAWNSRDPQRVALAYTLDSHWRNRTEFIQGRDEILAFLTRKWDRELDYRLIKELWSCGAFAKTESRCASLMSGATTAAIGSARMAMRIGNSTNAA